MTVHKGHLLEALRDSLAAGETTQAEILELLHHAGDKYPGHAAEVATNDDLEVDDMPLYSLSADGGVWVSAWVFVRDPESEESDNGR